MTGLATLRSRCIQEPSVVKTRMEDRQQELLMCTASLCRGGALLGGLIGVSRNDNFYVVSYPRFRLSALCCIVIVFITVLSLPGSSHFLICVQCLSFLVKLSLLAKWLARKTPLMTPHAS